MNSARFWAAVLALLLLASPDAAQAVKYMSLEQAVKSFVPAGLKVFKVTKHLTSEQRARIREDYDWDAGDESYSFYVGKRADGAPVAYVMIVIEVFNTCFHKYAVGLEPDGQVIDLAVVELSCPRAFPINRKSFLKQFRGKAHADALTTRLDIDAVTGATLSSEASAVATRKAASLHHVLFGGAARLQVAAEVKAARERGAGVIRKAIETGETLSKDGEDAPAGLPDSD